MRRVGESGGSVRNVIEKSPSVCTHFRAYSFHYSFYIARCCEALSLSAEKEEDGRVLPGIKHTQWLISPFPPVMSLSAEGDIILKQSHSNLTMTSREEATALQTYLTGGRTKGGGPVVSSRISFH